MMMMMMIVMMMMRIGLQVDCLHRHYRGAPADEERQVHQPHRDLEEQDAPVPPAPEALRHSRRHVAHPNRRRLRAARLHEELEILLLIWHELVLDVGGDG